MVSSVAECRRSLGAWYTCLEVAVAQCDRPRRLPGLFPPCSLFVDIVDLLVPTAAVAHYFPLCHRLVVVGVLPFATN